MIVDPLVRVGEAVFASLEGDLKRQNRQQVILVADENTYQACGGLVEAAVHGSGQPLKRLILHGKPWVAADESSVAQVLHALDGQACILAAVGSGTITDIVRYVAFQARLPFISIPTAASVDAYTSITASITLKQVKHSFLTRPAQAVYAHLPTLCAAPYRLTAAGFSDMAAKYTALADWKLAQTLGGDPYHEQVAQQAWEAVQACVKQVAAIRAGIPEGIQTLFDGLATSGRCMAAVKSSRPAAGSEHSLAHFWEINHQLQHLPESLHGEKTGAASVIIAQIYQQLRGLSVQEAARRLQNFHLPDPQEAANRLRMILGPAAEAILTARPSFLGTMRDKMVQVKANLTAHWDSVQAAAAMVPAPEDLVALLEAAGACNMPAQIHVQAEEVEQSLENAMYVRDRLTILELNCMLGLTSTTQSFFEV